jgi:hypothetical protein
MQLRARHILPPLAVAGLGGAIGGYLRWRKRRHARPAEPARDEAGPAEIDGIPTGPVELEDVEVVVLDADLLDDDVVDDLAVLDDVGTPGFDVLVMVEPEREDEATSTTRGGMEPDDLGRDRR